MTVRELIAQLQELDPDLTVGIDLFDDEDHYFGSVSVAKKEYVGDVDRGDYPFAYLYPEEENILDIIEKERAKTWPTSLFYEEGPGKIEIY